MIRLNLLIVALGLILVASPCPGMAQAHADDGKTLQGLWSGSWGGGQRDGVIFTPVIAEMVVEGDRIELHDFPEVGKLRGTVRVDTDKRRLLISPANPAASEPAKVLEYQYEIAPDKLTLRVGDKEAVRLQKLPLVQNPLANVQVELVGAARLNEAGDLLVTRVTALRANVTGTTSYQAEPQKLSTKQASIYVVQATGLKAVTLEAARELVRQEPPVVVTFRPDDQPPTPQVRTLWKDVGAAVPDSEAALQTFARLLRPGTLIFVLAARENIPQP